jgi:hypothetical protein
MANGVFDGLVYYLPVFIPFALTVFTVVSRLIAGTMDLTVRRFLKTYNEIVLGSFSFLVWGLISWLQTGRIDLNSNEHLPPAKLVVLLILAVILLVVAAIVSRYEWKTTEVGWRAEKKERTADVVMIVITLAFFLLPLGLVSSIETVVAKPSPTVWTVGLAWDDPSIRRLVGQDAWKSRQVSRTFHVLAVTQEGARSVAERKLRDSGELSEAGGKKHDPLSLAEEGVCIGRLDSVNASDGAPERK